MPVVIDTACQVIVPPIQIRIHTYLISCIADLIAKGFSKLLDRVISKADLAVILQIIIHRICQIVSLDQSQYVIRFTFGFRCILSVRIDINSERNS